MSPCVYNWTPENGIVDGAFKMAFIVPAFESHSNWDCLFLIKLHHKHSKSKLYRVKMKPLRYSKYLLKFCIEKLPLAPELSAM